MKKINTIILCSALAAMPACSGFLDQNPTTSLSEKTVYSSESTLESQVTGCYLSMHDSYLWKGCMAEFFHTSSGLLMWKGIRNTDEWLDGLNFAKYSTNDAGNTRIWRALYSGINRCNRLLAALPDSPVEQSFKTEVEAEVRLIRAILYFTAVRIWGDVPLILEPAEDYNHVNNPRMHFVKVYTQVLEDLIFAEQNMRSAARQEEVNPGKGRPNRWAATSMKASVYITIASLLDSPDDNFWDNDKPGRTPDFSGLGIRTADDAYRLAYNTAENVIQNGPYSLVPDYRTLFRWSEAGDWFLPERIICLESTPEAGQNYNSVRMLPQYPEGSANTVTENRNWGRVRPSRFLIDNFIRVGGGFKGTEETTQDIYQTTTDPRYDASFFTSFLNQSTQKTVKTYPLVIVSSSDATAFPYYKKYLDPSYDVTNGKADFYLMRLAELYLISAEASAGLCSSIGDNYSQRALDRLNDIRRRARQSTDSGEEALNPVELQMSDFSSPQELLNMVFWDRVCELTGEGHERFDTHRHGATWLRDNIAIPENHFLEDNPNHDAHWRYSYIGAEERGYTFPTDVQQLRKSLLSSVPYSEVTYNTKIDGQNDFYWQ